jgi:HSP20 family molecular chaperone IbpA
MFNSDWFFSDPFFRAPVWNYDEPEHTFHLAAHEVEDGVVVELEVPRYRSEDIKVTTDLATGIVTIEGRRPETRQGTQAHTSTSVPAFKRAFTVAPSQYDLTKLTSSVENGLLTIHVPRKPREEPKPIAPPKFTNVAIANAAAPVPASTDKQLAVAGKANQVAELPKRGQWPPRMQMVEKTAAGVAQTYDVALPPAILPENVKLSVLEDGTLRVDVSYSVRKESDHGYEEQSGSFSRYVSLPEGTKPEDVSARLEGGHLKIDVKEVAKKQ